MRQVILNALILLTSSVTLAHAEITSRQADRVRAAATVCSEVTTCEDVDIATHPSRGGFHWSAATGRWRWSVDRSHVAFSTLDEKGETFCDVDIVLPRATRRDMQRLGVAFALDHDYAVGPGAAPDEILFGAAELGVFVLRAVPEGYQMTFGPY